MSGDTRSSNTQRTRPFCCHGYRLRVSCLSYFMLPQPSASNIVALFEKLYDQTAWAVGKILHFVKKKKKKRSFKWNSKSTKGVCCVVCWCAYVLCIACSVCVNMCINTSPSPTCMPQSRRPKDSDVDAAHFASWRSLFSSVASSPCWRVPILISSTHG